MDRQEYMELLARQIRCRKAIPLVTKELEAHIEEQKEYFMKEGRSEQEAEQMAVREMGDPVEVGIGLDGIHRPKMNWRLIFFVGLISIVSLGAWYCLNVRMAEGELTDSAFGLFIRYSLYYAAGFMGMIGICYMDYTWFAARAKKIMVVYCVLLAVLVTSFDPISEIYEEGCAGAMWLIAYLFIPLYCGVLYSYRKTGVSGIVKGVAWSFPIVFSLFVCGNKLELLLFLAVLASVLSYAVYIGTFRVSVRKTLAGIWSVTAVLFAGLMLAEDFGGYKAAAASSEYRDVMIRGRDTVRDIMLGSRAIGRAGEYTGIAAKASKAAGIFPTEDGFTLAYIAVCFGTFAVAVAVLVIGALLLRFISLMVRQKNRLGRLTGLGCGLVLAVHAAAYLLENTGFIIPEQMYCPFTVGGREAIVTYVLLGIMLSIYRYQSISEA